MLTQNIHVVDQFGSKLSIQATFNKVLSSTHTVDHIKHITVDGENIRPSFEMLFQSNVTTKIYRVI